MTIPKGAPRKVMANPFFVVLLAASTAFVVTALMYYVSPLALDRPGPGPGPGSRALIDWLDRRGPLVLGAEFVVMCASGVVAMATDDWFAPARTPRRSDDPGPKDSKAP